MSKKRNKLYELYLKSDEWKRKSNDCKKLADFECNRCGSGENLHAHHKTYDRIGEELQEDLECLCLRCHEVEHGTVFKSHKKKCKKGWRKVYPIIYDKIMLELGSKLEKNVFYLIRDSFKRDVSEASFNQVKIAKSFDSTRPTINRIFRKLEKLGFLYKLDNGAYLMNPYGYVPYMADSELLQVRWDEMTGDENE